MVNEYFSGTLLFQVTDRDDFGLPPFLLGLLLPDTDIVIVDAFIWALIYRLLVSLSLKRYLPRSRRRF